MRGPFSANDSVNDVGLASQGPSYRENVKLTEDEPFARFAQLKSIEYIHQQFHAYKNSREAQLDTKNACFSDLYTQVDDLVKKLYSLYVMTQSQNMKIKTFEETMV